MDSSSSSNRAHELGIAIEEIKSGAVSARRAASERLLDLWRARRSTKLAEVLEHLAPATITITNNLASMTKQLEEDLRPRVPDPSVARAVLSFLRATPFTSRRSKDMWLVVFELIEKSGDPRVPGELSQIIDMGATLQVADAMREWLVNWMKNTLRDLPKEPPPEEPDEKTKALVQELALLVVPQKSEFAEQKEKTSQEKRAGLFAAVYASPDDDGPREVLADHLLEINDPLGEFITLQLKKGEPTQREQDLLKKHRKEWLGELFRFTHAGGVEFRRGFPAEASMKITSAREAEWASNIPAWATLEKVQCSWSDRQIPQTLHAVREISHARDETIAMIANHPHIRPIAIRCAHPLGDLDAWKKLEASHASERLKIVDNVPLRFLSDSLKDRLEEIHLPVLHTLTREIADLLRARPAKLKLFLRLSICRFELQATAKREIQMIIHPINQISEWQLRGYGFESFAKFTQHVRTEGTPRTGAHLLLAKLEEAIATWDALQDWDFGSIGGTKGSRAAPKVTPDHPRLTSSPQEQDDDDLQARAQTFFASGTQPSSLFWTTRDDGTLIAAEKGGLCAINAATGTVRALVATSDVLSPSSVTADGRIAVLQHARSVHFCDPIDGKPLHEDIAATLKDDPSSFRALSKNGRFLLTRESIIDLETKAVTAIGRQNWLGDLHSNGKRWLTALAQHEILPTTEEKTTTKKKRKTTKKTVSSVPQRLTILPTLEGSTGLRAIRFLDPNDDASRLIVMLANAQQVDNAPCYRVARVDLLCDAEPPIVLFSRNYPGTAQDIAITEEFFAIAHFRGITLLDAESGDVRLELPTEAPALKVAIHPNATQLFYKTRDQLVAYDLEDDREIWSLAFR